MAFRQVFIRSVNVLKRLKGVFMEKIKIIVVDGIVESVLSTTPNIDVEVVNTSWTKYQEEIDKDKESMRTVY